MCRYPTEVYGLKNNIRSTKFDRKFYFRSEMNIIYIKLTKSNLRLFYTTPARSVVVVSLTGGNFQLAFA